MAKSNAPKINWAPINARIAGIAEKVTEQNFCLDVAHRIFSELKLYLDRRNDLNLPVISAYWAKETLEHFKLNDYKPLLDREVFIESNYYSYMNLSEMKDVSAKTGEATYVIDLISDSTDTKKGEDLVDWMSINQSFQNELRNIWKQDVLSYWIKEDKLVTRKKVVKLEDYWKVEDYLYLIRVWDPELNIKIVFIVGTYDNYI